MTCTSMPSSAAKRSTRRTTEPLVSSSQRLRRLEPRTIWVIWCSRAKIDERSGRVVAGHLVPVRRRRRRRAAQRRRGLGGPRRPLVAPPRARRAGRALVRAAIRAARRSTASVPGAPVTATMMRSVVSHTVVEMAVAQVARAAPPRSRRRRSAAPARAAPRGSRSGRSRVRASGTFSAGRCCRGASGGAAARARSR